MSVTVACKLLQHVAGILLAGTYVVATVLVETPSLVRKRLPAGVERVERVVVLEYVAHAVCEWLSCRVRLARVRHVTVTRTAGIVDIVPLPHV
jgi:hypothetical protein